MSGGFFDYSEDRISEIAEDIEDVIKLNRVEDFYGEIRDYSDQTIQLFREGIEALKIAKIYAHNIDFFISGDYSEESFLKCLREDLEKLKKEGVK